MDAFQNIIYMLKTTRVNLLYYKTNTESNNIIKRSTVCDNIKIDIKYESMLLIRDRNSFIVFPVFRIILIDLSNLIYLYKFCRRPIS